MRVWIDFANSPHPLLFAPIARRFEELGDQVVVTARDHAQTVELARARWPEVTVIGGRSPGGRGSKVRVLAGRVRELRRWAAESRPHIALSHNSYAQIVAARLANIRVVTAMDYEYQPANHLAFRLAHRILLPAVLPASVVRRQGATPRKVTRYEGLKEELYVGDFEFDASVVSALGIERDDRPLVVFRSPPVGATYHQFENPRFLEILEWLGRCDALVVVLARGPEECNALTKFLPPNAVMPDHAVDARSLIYAADLMIGAGGTMTREAAVLGVPAISIFGAHKPAVDRWLERQGRLQQITSTEEAPVVGPRSADPRPLTEVRASGRRLTNTFVAAVREHASS